MPTEKEFAKARALYDTIKERRKTMGFCLANAVKYIWRAGLKSESPLEDLKKARWYIDREIARLEKR